jgi:hypothetical protein
MGEMTDPTIKQLSIRPGRLLAEQAAALLGFKKHEISILANARLLKPLANPPRNAVKYYATVEIEQYARDPEWQAKATRAVYKYWAEQNQKRRQIAKDSADACKNKA